MEDSLLTRFGLQGIATRYPKIVLVFLFSTNLDRAILLLPISWLWKKRR